MLQSYLIAIKRADWRSPVLLAMLGGAFFFVWRMIKLGAPSGTDPVGHYLGVCIVSMGWTAIGAGVLLLWHEIKATLR